MPDIWELAATGAKFLLYLGVLGSTGLVLVRIVFRRETDAMAGLLRRQASGFAFLALLAAGLGFSFTGAALSGDAAGLIDPEMLGLLWATAVGTRLAALCAGLVLLLGGLRIAGPGIWAALAGGVLALWSFSRVGHVADAGQLWLEALLLAHLAGVAFWIGILPPLRRLAGKDGNPIAAAALGRRFGRIAAVTVPALIAAGAVMAWRLAGDVGALAASAYGLTLLAKIGAVLVLLGAAAANKLRYVPAMTDGDRTAAAGLRRSIAVEWAAVCATLLITAVLTDLAGPPTRGHS